MRLSFEVQAGLLMRQVHHWTALVFLGAIAVHLARIFFTGAFRRPREINWLIGLGLLAARPGRGDHRATRCPTTSYREPALRIIDSVILSIPFVGPWVASLFFGGEFPTPDILSRLFVFHVMLLPGLLIGGIGAHLGLVWLQKHTQYRSSRTREDNVVGLPFWPGQAFRSLGLFFLTAAVMTLVAGLIQINPVWLYGPYMPYVASVPGAARLVRRLARGRAAPGPADRADDPGRHDPVAVRARDPDPRPAGRGARDLAVRRGAADPRPSGAPPARPAVAHADPDRDRAPPASRCSWC